MAENFHGALNLMPACCGVQKALSEMQAVQRQLAVFLQEQALMEYWIWLATSGSGAQTIMMQITIRYRQRTIPQGQDLQQNTCFEAVPGTILMATFSVAHFVIGVHLTLGTMSAVSGASLVRTLISLFPFSL